MYNLWLYVCNECGVDVKWVLLIFGYWWCGCIEEMFCKWKKELVEVEVGIY